MTYVPVLCQLPPAESILDDRCQVGFSAATALVTMLVGCCRMIQHSAHELSLIMSLATFQAAQPGRQSCMNDMP